MTDDQILEVVQAHKDGKQIQARRRSTYYDWGDDPSPSWDFETWEFRVKPEPMKLREGWVREAGLWHRPPNNDRSTYIHVREIIEEEH